MNKSLRGAALVLAVTVSGGCGPGPVPGGDDVGPGTGAGGAAPAAQAPARVQALRRQAAEAMADGRVHGPAGRNAVEAYLALTSQVPGDRQASDALQALQPYVLIAIEQALAAGDAHDAGRLLDLLTRMEPRAPALGRLEAALVRLAQRPLEQASPPTHETTDAALPLAPPAPVAGDPAPAALQAQDSLPRPAAPAPMQAAASVPARPAPQQEPQHEPQQDLSAAPAPVSPRATGPAQAQTGLPRLLADVAPRYPRAALNRRLEGEVSVGFRIGPDGRVSDVTVLRSQPADVFDRAALAAAQAWRFEPSGQWHGSSRQLVFRLDGVSVRDATP